MIRSCRYLPTLASFSLFYLSLLAGCRQPTMWTPKPPYGTTTGTNDFDLTAKANDPNGSPSDPRWAPQDMKSQNPNSQTLPPINCQQKAQPYQSGCTDQAKFLVQDVGSGLNGLFCTLFGDSSSINGHADWTAATAQGPIGWLNFAEDFDYNLLLLPEQQSGLTEDNNIEPGGNDRYMEVEFDSREFDGRFGTSWWREFARLAEEGAQSGDYTAIQNYLHSGPGLAYGVVYGIFGIDCEHGCRSEIHPAYAVAIQVNSSKDSNQWAIFARNWGDEGFCSHLDHQLDLSSTQNALRLMLPYHSSAGPSVKKYEVGIGGQNASRCPNLNFVKSDGGAEGEMITIPLPPPDQQGLTDIFLELQWPDGAHPVEYKHVDKKGLTDMAKQRVAEEDKPGKNESAEARFGRLRRRFYEAKEGKNGKRLPEKGFREGILKRYVEKMPPAKQRELLMQGAAPPPPPPNAPLACQALEVAATPPPPPPPGAPPQVPAKPQKLRKHKSRDLWDPAVASDFCEAYAQSGKQLDGESPDSKAKLDKFCSDKRLKP